MSRQFSGDAAVLDVALLFYEAINIFSNSLGVQNKVLQIHPQILAKRIWNFLKKFAKKTIQKQTNICQLFNNSKTSINNNLTGQNYTVPEAMDIFTQCFFSIWTHFRGKSGLTLRQKWCNFGSKWVQLQKPAINNKQSPKKWRKTNTGFARPDQVNWQNHLSWYAAKVLTKILFHWETNSFKHLMFGTESYLKGGCNKYLIKKPSHLNQPW